MNESRKKNAIDFVKDKKRLFQDAQNLMARKHAFLSDIRTDVEAVCKLICTFYSRTLKTWWYKPSTDKLDVIAESKSAYVREINGKYYLDITIEPEGGGPLEKMETIFPVEYLDMSNEEIYDDLMEKGRKKIFLDRLEELDKHLEEEKKVNDAAKESRRKTKNIIRNMDIRIEEIIKLICQIYEVDYYSWKWGKDILQDIKGTDYLDVEIHVTLKNMAYKNPDITYCYFNSDLEIFPMDYLYKTDEELKVLIQERKTH